MRIKTLIIFVGFLALMNPSISQTYEVKRTEFLETIYKSDRSIQNIVKSGIGFVPALFLGKPTNQTIIKNNNGLYILAEFTGQVYKLSSAKDSSFYFTRIDSTKLDGYNGGAIIFSYKDELYSLGGYGFWRMNGQLRRFDTALHEWTSVRLNKEYHFSNFNYYYDEELGEMYIIQHPNYDEIAKNEKTDFIVLKLDLNTKTIEEIGKPSNFIQKLDLSRSLLSLISSTPKGSYTFIGNQEIYLFSFNQNKLFKVTNSFVNQILFGKNLEYPKNLFCLDSTIYFSYSGDSLQKLYSINLRSSNFELIPDSLYELNKPGITNYTVWILGILTGSSILAIIILVQLNKKKNAFPKNKSDKKNGNVFDEIELSIIKHICAKDNPEKMITVEKINHLLGLSRKSSEIQRKIRNEVINNINYKFREAFSNNIDLIDRVRSEEDKRYVYYVIKKEQNEILLKVGVL